MTAVLTDKEAMNICRNIVKELDKVGYSIVSKNNIVNTTIKSLKTKILLHPGEVIEMELETRGIKKSTLAFKLNTYPARISEIIQGKKDISTELALKLEGVLGVSAEFWLHLQADYNVGKFRKKLSINE